MKCFKKLVIFAVLFVSNFQAQDLKKSIEKYLDHNTKEEEQYQLLSELQKSFTSQELKPLLIAQINDGQKRKRALHLATSMNVSGLYNSVKKHVDSDDFLAILKYLLTVQDEDGTKFLFEMWKKSDVNSKNFTLLSEAFQQYKVDLNCITRFKSFLKLGDDDKQKQSAVKILCFQMNVSSEKEINEQWKQFEKSYKNYTKKFSSKGVDLLEKVSEITNATKVVNNFYLKPGGRIDCANLPKHINKGSFIVKVRVLVISGSEAQVGITMEQGAWSALLNKESEWVVRTGNATEFARVPVKIGQWSEVAFVIKDESTEKVRYNRNVAISVDGTTILDNGSCNGLFEEVYIISENAEMVVGGVELLK